MRSHVVLGSFAHRVVPPGSCLCRSSLSLGRKGVPCGGPKHLRRPGPTRDGCTNVLPRLLALMGPRRHLTTCSFYGGGAVAFATMCVETHLRSATFLAKNHGAKVSDILAALLGHVFSPNLALVHVGLACNQPGGLCWLPFLASYRPPRQCCQRHCRHIPRYSQWRLPRKISGAF